MENEIWLVLELRITDKTQNLDWRKVSAASHLYKQVKIEIYYLDRFNFI